MSSLSRSVPGWLALDPLLKCIYCCEAAEKCLYLDQMKRNKLQKYFMINLHESNVHVAGPKPLDWQ